MTNPLHDAAMAAKRFHDAALAYLDGTGSGMRMLAEKNALEYAIKATNQPDMNAIQGVYGLRGPVPK